MKFTHTDICVLVYLGGRNQNTIDWMGYEQQKYISHGSGGWKSEIWVPARLSEGSLLSCRLLNVSSWGEPTLQSFFYQGTNAIHEVSTHVI